MKAYHPDFPPMEHQSNALKMAWQHEYFAFFHEMGLGKSYIGTSLANGRYQADQINALLVLCPTPIKLVWEEELVKFSTSAIEVFTMESGKNRQAAKFIEEENPDSMKCMIVGIESLSQGKAFELALDFVKKYQCMVSLDESSRIKNPTASRTRKAIQIGTYCPYRYIFTGTPITQGMEDLYSQFRFLHDSIIGCKSFFVFKNRYCLIGGFENRQIVGYQNQDELLERVAPYSDTKKKEDCMDLPDKIYEKVTVEATKQQKDALQALKDTFIAEMGEDTLTVSTILERMTRYQQIIGGNFPYDNEGDGNYETKPIDGKNPKLEALLEVIESIDIETKVIIWARFRPEIAQISEALKSKYDEDQTVEFHGGVSQEQRKAAVSDFQGGEARFFISNQATGGMGITLTAATLVIYYSNDFSYENRIQSEDRAHRKGQTNKVTYVDIEMNMPEDRMILKAIRTKQDLAKFVDRELRGS